MRKMIRDCLGWLIAIVVLCILSAVGWALFMFMWFIVLGLIAMVVISLIAFAIKEWITERADDDPSET